jgi:hypothetical protein
MRADVNNDAAMSDTTPLNRLRPRLTESRAAIGVAGLGYPGLPLEAELARNATPGPKPGRAKVVRR